jgi:alpha-tubulin suppressor-like RCC1 family protein
MARGWWERRLQLARFAFQCIKSQNKTFCNKPIFFVPQNEIANTDKPTQIAGTMALAAGREFAVGLCGPDRIFCWGEIPLHPLSKQQYVKGVRQIAASRHELAAVTHDGQMLISRCGQNGVSLIVNRTGMGSFQQIQPSAFGHVPVFMVACGKAHKAVATTRGALYTWGSAFDGQLGLGPNSDRVCNPQLVPQACFADMPVTMVACGGHFTAAVTARGVFTWGANHDGQLGHNSRVSCNTPKQVDAGCFGAEKPVFIAAGHNFMAMVSAHGHLFTCGCNLHGQLGLVFEDNVKAPRNVLFYDSQSFAMAACGEAHTLLVDVQGSMWASGLGDSGQLGLEDKWGRREFFRIPRESFHGERVVVAAAGTAFAVAVTESGRLYQWGVDFGTQPLAEKPLVIPTPRFDGVTFQVRTGEYDDHVLAFAMAVHARLGQDSPVYVLAGEKGLVKIIAELFKRRMVVPGDLAEYQGYLHLMGERFEF